MSLHLKLVLFLAGIALLVGAAVTGFVLAIWFGLSEQEQDFLARISSKHVAFGVVFALLLLGGLGLILGAFFKLYVSAASELADEAKLIALANQTHRIEPRGGAEIRRLAAAINELAERHQATSENVEEAIRAAQADLAEERNTLAALMSELTLGVVVCNREGGVLLYNSAAAQLFALEPEPHSSNGPAASLIGLGRSIFRVMDRNLLVRAVQEVRDRIEDGEASPVAEFMGTASSGQLVRVQLAPVQSQPARPGGFVLALEDVTSRAEASRRRYALQQLLAQDAHSSVARIREAVDSLLDEKTTGPARRRGVLELIREETATLSTHVDRTLVESSSSFRDDWPQEEMLGSDLLFAVRRSLERKLGLTTTSAAIDDNVWLKIDGHSLVQEITDVMTRLPEGSGIGEVALDLERAGSLCRLNLTWRGSSPDPTAAHGLREVAGSHGGEAFLEEDKRSGCASLRLVLPVITLEPSLPAERSTDDGVPESRPAVYDFDLFHQPALGGPLDDRPLTEIPYTVLDTETTGMDPSSGDEVISLGAVRIVNGHLRWQEAFDQLIHPGRQVPEESRRIHGISSEMLEGEPSLAEVLPLFAEFAKDTVLLGYCVAFDMRFFELKEAQTGVRLTQPLLDVLLLSAVVHPEAEDHSLEAIAERLGVSVIGRHTSLGDAILTGEIFLKLLPLLADRGVRTLGDAREASQATGLAGVRY